MAGGHVKYRALSRDSSARWALLRGLVTQLVQHEHIQTTHAKAKEAQKLADKLITLAKRNNEPCRRSAQGILYTPDLFMGKLFGELRERYLTREGGYTRVVRTEPRDTHDQAETSILEFVDGPKDSRFMMTAKTVARDRLLGRDTFPVTQINIKKVTQFRGVAPFEAMVRRFMALDTAEGTSESDRYGNQQQQQQGEKEQEQTLLSKEASLAAAREGARSSGMGEQIVPEAFKRPVKSTK